MKKRPRPAPAPAAGRHLLAVVSIAVLGAVLYARCLDGPFVFDDPNAITQSTLIRSLTPLSKFIAFSTRPLTDISFALDYARDGYDPRPYHVTNLLLHILTGLLLYAVTLRTLGLPGLEPRYGAHRQPIAWAAAALFVAHPLASETVAYVSSRSEVLVAVFYQLALLCYVVAACAQRRAVGRAAVVALPCTTAVAVASKEIAVTIPVALLLYDWCFLAGGNWRGTRPRWRLIALALLPMALGGAFLAYRAYMSPSPLGSYGATAGLGFDRFGPFQYLYTQFGVVVHYLRLVLLPFGQTFDYDWPVATSVAQPYVLFSFGILALLLFFAVRQVRAQPLFSFAVLWTFLVLAPTSSVLPIADPAVERRMYIPLLGITPLAAAWLWDLADRLMRSSAAARRNPATTYAALVAVALIPLAILTAQRAALWGDPLALHRDAVVKAPRSPRAWLNLGVIYLNQGDYDPAYEKLAEAKRLYDRGESLHAFPRIGAFIQYNLGAVLYVRKEYDRAIPELERALQIGGHYLALRPMAYSLLANIATVRADWSQATKYYEEALRFQPDNTQWRIGLAQARMKDGKPRLAAQALRVVFRTDPDNAQAKALWKRLPPLARLEPSELAERQARRREQETRGRAKQAGQLAEQVPGEAAE